MPGGLSHKSSAISESVENWPACASKNLAVETWHCHVSSVGDDGLVFRFEPTMKMLRIPW